MAGCVIPILALAAAAAGTGLQVAGSNRAREEMNNKTMEELLRQRGIQDKAAKEFAKSLQGSSEEVVQQQLQEGETEKSDLYTKLQSVPLAAGSQQLVGGGSPVQNLQDAAQMSISNQGRAKLGRYDKWMLDQAVKNLHSGQMQGLYGQEAQRSQNILPMELQDASHAGDKMMGIGQGLGLLSSLLSMGSLAGLGGTSAAASTVGTPVTAAQNSAFLSGFGPVNASYAAGLMGNTGSSLGSGLYGMLPALATPTSSATPIMGYGYGPYPR